MKLLLKYISLILIIITLFVFDSCSIETYATKKIAADEDILLYMNDNDLNFKPNSSGLVFIPIRKGEGGFPQDGDKVAFHYKGYYFDGNTFDSSYDKLPIVVKLGCDMIINGLEESLKLMNKGSKAKVLIPFYLAYKDMENAPVPPYSNLIFEIELIDFTSDK